MMEILLYIAFTSFIVAIGYVTFSLRDKSNSEKA